MLSLFEDGNGKAINSTVSVWIWALPPLFSSNEISFLLSNRVYWDNRKNVYNDVKSIFERCFHGHRHFWIVRSLLTSTRCWLSNFPFLSLLLFITPNLYRGFTRIITPLLWLLIHECIKFSHPILIPITVCLKKIAVTGLLMKPLKDFSAFNGFVQTSYI